ncbi:MAG: hypothetical protein HC788_09355 [Sphingopyxis sp.]|nr:hypothetical protein [Sphingopyxis sp.]
MREAFNNQGSLETYAALIRLNSDLYEASRTPFDPVRAPDRWDELAELARNWHAADINRKIIELETRLASVSQERDMARGELALLRAGGKLSHRQVTYDWDDDDRSARAIDGSVTLTVEDMEEIAREQEASASDHWENPTLATPVSRVAADDEVPF